ncbi:MAG: hypothetical protein KJ850_05685 [Gammaproteobacteria bacterium]|nr:hypothetical protein [Gammaproteobacteria bacterium]MBU1624524.1 hypothetical protein [Gammaproteobacteria bacterium]MBU1982368.1 hypothetical protein [Gammaproteobacteria bacterium]
MLFANRRHFVPVIALVLFLLSGCEAIFYGAGLTSALAVNELDRYSLPELKEIDRAVLQRYEGASRTDISDSFTDPLAVAGLVQIFNDNRHFWKKEFRITPPTIREYNQPDRFTLLVYSNNFLIRSYHLEKKILRTTNEAGVIIRELSEADADSLSRLVTNVNSQLLYFPYLR